MTHNQTAQVLPPPDGDVEQLRHAIARDPTDVGIGVLDTRTGQIYLAPASSLEDGDHASLLEQVLGITDIDEAAPFRGFVVGRAGGQWAFANMSGLNPANNQMEDELFRKVKDAVGPRLGPCP